MSNDGNLVNARLKRFDLVFYKQVPGFEEEKISWSHALELAKKFNIEKAEFMLTDKSRGEFFTPSGIRVWSEER